MELIDRNHVDRLLEQALELPAAERTAFLDRNCDTVELKNLLTRLLTESADVTELEFGVALWQQMAAEVRPALLAPNTLVGPYRILSELGRGGMAVVYLAERADGEFEQQVALKILERPATDELAVRRFHLERKILASLEHPHIARLQDGGIAPDGRPFFVMERVDGLPIDRYCNESRLTVAERLRLFALVGKAVAAAHRQLIVHRDLKPSNILVTHDGVPKLLDFGIAKLLEAEPGGFTSPALTRTAMLVLTPEYASPEQLAGRPVTTASDVYQLGLLLRRLVDGAAPRQGSGRGLSGDLKVILATALSPEAERRYESVTALVEDVERTLEGRPILARRPSLGYRLGKFVRRNRWPVAAAAAGLVLVVGGTVYHAVRLTRERDRAEREATKARRVAEFLVEVFKSPNAREGKKAVAVTALEVVDRGARKLESELGTELDGQPEVKASLLYNLGRVYGSLFEFERAAALLDQAIALQTQHLGGEALETLDSRTEKAALEFAQDRVDESLGELRQILAARERTQGASHPAVASCLYQMSQLLVRQGNLAEAYETGARSLAILEAQPNADPSQLSRGHQAVAMALSNLGRGEESLPHHRRAAELLRSLDPEHPLLGQALAQQANQLWGVGQLEAARPVFAEAVRLLEKVQGVDSPRTAVVLLQAADAEVEAGNADAALMMIDRGLVSLEQALSPSHFWVGQGHVYRGYALKALGRFAEALDELQAGRRVLAAAISEQRSAIIQCDLQITVVLSALKRTAEAKELAATVRSRAQANPSDMAGLLPLVEETLAGLGLE